MLSSSLQYEKLCWQFLSVLTSVFILSLSCEVPYQKQLVSSLAGRYWQLEEKKEPIFLQTETVAFQGFFSPTSGSRMEER